MSLLSGNNGTGVTAVQDADCNDNPLASGSFKQ